VNFEELVERPAETVAAAGEFLNEPIRLDSKNPGPSKRSPDPLKEDWKRRFLDGN
jgi:hypothetical protein